MLRACASLHARNSPPFLPEREKGWGEVSFQRREVLGALDKLKGGPLGWGSLAILP